MDLIAFPQSYPRKMNEKEEIIKKIVLSRIKCMEKMRTIVEYTKLIKTGGNESKSKPLDGQLPQIACKHHVGKGRVSNRVESAVWKSHNRLLEASKSALVP